MEKVRPWCGQPSDRGWLRNRTEQNVNDIKDKHNICVTLNERRSERRASKLQAIQKTTESIRYNG